MKNNLHKNPEIPAIPLLFCPFCGGDALLQFTEVPDWRDTGNHEIAWHVECAAPLPSKCPGKYQLTNSAKEAAKRWNMRAI